MILSEMWRGIKNFLHLLQAWYWVVRCGWPARKLYVVGVTGTDGKTTTCTLIYEILKKAGFKVGLISTVEAIIGNEKISTGLHTTNPGPEILQPLLRKMVEAGVTHVVLEVTSHGLDQNRVAGCNFKIGVLTNVTHEHLDYHGKMQNYINSKLKLFKNTDFAVLNQDDPSFEKFKFLILNFNSNPNVKILKYSKTGIKGISETLAGDYNKYNIGAAETVAKILGVEKVVPLVVRSFSGVPGRREEVRAGQDFRVVVDFAHTPNALEQVLGQLKKELYHLSDPPLKLRGENQLKPKIILVFGCTGERDKEKRPMMVEIAERLADAVIVTSDDTRSESQDEIAGQILAGMDLVPELDQPHHPFSSPLLNSGEGLEVRYCKVGNVYKPIIKENDRKKAIETAIKMAEKDDIVLLAGKGHEKTILLGKTEYQWSDVGTAKSVLQRLI